MKVLIIGGNRFFGKHLATELLREGDSVTLLNRGNLDDGLVGKVVRLKADRKDLLSMKKALSGKTWDLVFDQVCYDAQEAREAVSLFRGHVGKYIFTSSMSVYKEGANLVESDFESIKTAMHGTLTTDDYAQAKREAESVISYEMPEISACVRMGMVTGEDDHTGRLLWHMNHVKEGKAIFFPNKKASLSFIHSEQAGKALCWIGKSNHVGPINCASPGGLTLNDLIKMIEIGVKAKASLTMNGDKSPYGIDQDWIMNTDKLKDLGIQLEAASDWMPKLIKSIVTPKGTWLN